MYVHKGKRGFFVTIREVNVDNTLGDSESFSIYKSKINLTREELATKIIEVVNKTHQKSETP